MCCHLYSIYFSTVYSKIFKFSLFTFSKLNRPSFNLYICHGFRLLPSILLVLHASVLSFNLLLVLHTYVLAVAFNIASSLFCLFCLLIYCLFSILPFYLLPALLLLYFCTTSTLCHLCHPYGLFSLLLFAGLLPFLHASVLFTLFQSVDSLLYLLQSLLLVLFSSGFCLFPKPFFYFFSVTKFLNYFIMKLTGYLFHGTRFL